MSWPRLVCVVGSQLPVSASAPRKRSALPSAAKAEFTRKSGLTRPKPSAAAPASPPNITSLRLIMSHPSMIAATLKLLLEVARRSAVSIVLGNLLDNLLGDLLSDLQSVDQT